MPNQVATKDAADSLSQKMVVDGELEGSHEHTRSKLQDSLKAYCQQKKLCSSGYDSSAYILSVFPGYAIIEAGDSYSNRKHYKISWKDGTDGPEWTGEPTEVEVKAVVEEKAMQAAGLVVKDGNIIPAASLIVKAGRILSADSHAILAAARDSIKQGHDALHAFVEANKPDGATANKPDTHTSAHMPATDPDNPSVEKSAKTLAVKAIAAAYRNESTDAAILDLESAAATIKSAADALREQSLAELIGG